MRPLALVTLLALPALATPAPVPVVSFDDPAGDATGTGSYTPPGDSEFRDGDFDLRRFAVSIEGEDVVFEVTLGAPVRAPQVTQRSNSTAIPLGNGIYFQNIDIYVDQDPSPDAGFDACIPGRRVGFAGGRRWEHAVVLTPQPGPTRSVIDAAMGPAARAVTVVYGVQSRGRTLIARVPTAFFGAPPARTWGWSVHVSGARWDRSYKLQDRFGDGDEPDAFTMPVLPTPEAWAFGGAPMKGTPPRVVDVLLPPGGDQAAVLGGYGSGFAEVPFVYGEAPRDVAPPAEAAAPAAPSFLVVADVSGDLATLDGALPGLAPMRIGRVLGKGGRTVGRVVVTQVLEAGAVARIVEGRGRFGRGDQVVFD